MIKEKIFKNSFQNKDTMKQKILTKTDDLPIKNETKADGKVRSGYWLGEEDSKHLASLGLGYETNRKGVLVISDRVSAFEENWTSEGGLTGVPGKGASLNAISKFWFDKFNDMGLAENHIIASPHPMVWIVEQAQPIKIEAIARQYITGSMWRSYEKGKQEFCGIQLPNGLKKNQRLPELLLTPTTKGTIKGVEGVPEKEDVPITRDQIIDNYEAFGFRYPMHIPTYEVLLKAGFKTISEHLEKLGYLFVDTKFEFGYIQKDDGSIHMIYMDEVGTPDSSRYLNKALYQKGEIREDSKEFFRQGIINFTPNNEILLNSDMSSQRKVYAKETGLPDSLFLETGELYTGLAETITGKEMPKIENAREEILDALAPYGLLK